MKSAEIMIPVKKIMFTLISIFLKYRKLYMPTELNCPKHGKNAVVPVSSTRYCIDALNLQVVKAWHPWVDSTGEVAGYKVVYDGLSFATVRGAGHQVPQSKPHRALALLKKFQTGH